MVLKCYKFMYGFYCNKCDLHISTKLIYYVCDWRSYMDKINGHYEYFIYTRVKIVLLDLGYTIKVFKEAYFKIIGRKF